MCTSTGLSAKSEWWSVPCRVIVRTRDDEHRAKCLIHSVCWINGTILLTIMLSCHTIMMFFLMLTYPGVEYMVGMI